MMMQQIYILHDTDGHPYYLPIEFLTSQNRGKTALSYYESSVFRLLLRAVIKKKSPKNIINSTIRNLSFRFRVPFIKNSIIIIGMAPFDYRLLWYGMLWRKNKVILHTSFPEWDLKTVPRKYSFLSPLSRKLWIYILKKWEIEIVAVTEHVKQAIEFFVTPRLPIKVIPHAVDLAIFHAVDNKLSRTCLNIVFIGKLIPEKGIEVLNKIINELPKNKFSFSIIGDGPMNTFFKTKRDNVTFEGWIEDRSSIAQKLRTADILLLPSQKTHKWQELFGIVIIEAMASGVVPVASNHIGPSAIIDHGVDGYLLDENDISGFTTVLLSLYENSVLLGRMATAAVKKAKNYDVKRISKSWGPTLGI